jgi:hypothetical protein
MKTRNPGFTHDWKFAPSIFIIFLIIWAVTTDSLTGCSRERITPRTTPPTTSQMLTPSTAGDLESGQIVKSLTRSKWQQVRRQDPSLAAETVTWEFYTNGMFRWQITSDFSKTNIGAWTIAPTSEENGVMFLASTMNDPSEFDVLSLELQNSRLILGEFSYQETPFTGADAPPEVREDDRQAVTDQRDNFFSFWITVTPADWRSESAPSPGDANLYSFMRDGTYTAQFDVTKCQYAGTWSMSFSETESGVLRLSIPANACDPRGSQEAFIREIPIRLDGDKLILYAAVYVPERR